MRCCLLLILLTWQVLSSVWNLVTFNSSAMECISCLIDICNFVMRCESVFVSHFHSVSIGIGVKPSSFETHKQHNETQVDSEFLCASLHSGSSRHGGLKQLLMIALSRPHNLLFHFRPSGWIVENIGMIRCSDATRNGGRTPGQRYNTNKCTGWPFSLWRTCCWLQNKSSALDWLYTFMTKTCPRYVHHIGSKANLNKVTILSFL